MSLLQELGAQLRATSDELPTGQVTVALEKLRSATELLNWVRQASVDPIGVPLLGNALEHAERASAALRVAQDAIAAYLAQVGLAGEAGGQPDRDWRAGLGENGDRPRPPAGRTAPGPAGGGTPPAAEKLGPWWQQRVSELTGEPPPKPEEVARQHPSTADLLRRIAADVRSGDRARLGRDLHQVDAATGLGLSAVTPPVLHRLAGDLLGHEPRADDLNRLRTAVAGRVRSLLPGTSPGVLDTLLARICRVPGPAQPASAQPRSAQPQSAQPPSAQPPSAQPQSAQPGGSAAGHPADNAVTASVLTGVLLARLGREPGSLDPAAPEPLPRRADA
jgi:hypothetical protein